ncbi:MAG: serine/threonine-protein kinase, partial [Kiritimatiellaeota bacterium]|nr:serine/threonine-protein kinase [Kiritimatiellota bacterium]
MNTKKCPNCRTPLDDQAPEGLCPACLMKAGLETRAADVLTKPTTASADNPAKPNEGIGASLDIAEVRRRFPQLEIIEQIGRGGMGVVFKARQPQLDRLVALKILPAELARTPGFAERFAREARALARLNHPNIVSVFDFGEREGWFYFIMEFVDGANLGQLIAARQVTPETALALVPKICEALQFAHDEGILHRDIKPANILVDKKGRVKIADFGLAKLVGAKEETDHTLTVTGVTMGTPRYMAPEQFENTKTVDHRADIYSLGVVFYEMLTGEVPMGRFMPPSKKVQVDVRIDEVVLHSLEKEPEQRYQHV